MYWTRATAWLAVALAGCASNAPSTVLAEGPRMIDLYRGTEAPQTRTGPVEAGGEAPQVRCRWWLFTWPCEAPKGSPVAASPGGGGREATSYTRTAANELELLFPRLPNPDVYIHVLPHLATPARVPVPGYTTAVPLYGRVEYALPGELEPAVRALEGGAEDKAEADGLPAQGAPEDGTLPEGGEQR